MSETTNHIVRRANKEEAPKTAQTLSDAFQSEPIFDWFVRTDKKRESARYSMFLAIIEILGFGDCHVEILNDADAVSVWVPFPGELTPTISQEIKALPALFNASGLKRFGRMIKMRGVIKRYKEKGPHVYLWFLGVKPELQGKGLGGSLLDACLKKIDEEGHISALETATLSNVAFYKSRGFEVVHEFQIDETAPKVWTMRRMPRPIRD